MGSWVIGFILGQALSEHLMESMMLGGIGLMTQWRWPRLVMARHHERLDASLGE